MIPSRSAVPALLLALSLLAGCASAGGAEGRDGRLRAMSARGDLAGLLDELRRPEAADLDEGVRSALFEENYARAKEAYERIDREPGHLRDLLEVLWRLDGGDPRYEYLATAFAYLTGQYREVVRIGPSAFDSGREAKVAYMLAESHAALGEREKAREYYRMVLSGDLEGFDDVRARCRARIEELR